AAELGVAERIRFHGLLPDAAVGALMARAHWFVSAASYEGFGMAVAEAMASGLPPILNDIPAFRELVRHGEEGFLIEFAHEQSAAAELVRAVRSPIGVAEAAGVSARRAAARYAWPVVAGRFEAIYRDVVGGRSSVVRGRRGLNRRARRGR